MKIFQLKEAGQLEERIPLLFVDVNIAEGKTVRIVIYDKDKSDELARKFCEEYGNYYIIKIIIKINIIN